MPAEAAQLKFYASDVCPFAQRTDIALHELDVAHERIEIDLSNKPDWYAKVNPRGKVPALDVGNGTPLIESAIIAEYIAEKYSAEKNSLIPSDPLLKARLRLFFNDFEEGVRPNFYKLLMNQDAAQTPVIENALLNSLAALNEQLEVASKEGPFFLGNQFSLAEVQTIPFFVRFSVLEHFRNFKIPDEPRFARLHQWLSASLARESVVKTSIPVEDYIKVYAKYANPAPK